MPNSYKTSSFRSANVVQGDFQIETSTDGLRRAYSRNAKLSLGDGRYDVVRIWRLVRRDNLKSKWYAVTRQTGRAEAEAFLATGEK